MSDPSSPVFPPTSPSMTFDSPPPTTTSTSNSSSSGGSGSNGSNYFFGFIATFIVLLLIFVTCGMGSRRRSRFIASTWGRTFEGNELDEGVYGGLPAAEWLKYSRSPPRFREAHLRPAQGVQHEAPWQDLQPISASLVRSPLSTSTSKASPTLLQSLSQEATLPQSSMPHLPIWKRLFDWLTRPWTSQLPDLPPPLKFSSPEAVQVAVVVTMPSPFTSRCYAEGKGEGPSTLICPPLDDSISGGYEIGVIQLPWSKGEIT